MAKTGDKSILNQDFLKIGMLIITGLHKVEKEADHKPES